ncbi:MAG: PAS domain S-box protein [Bacteroidales bacterium]|jgi:PAS domain S-box-containing protein
MNLREKLKSKLQKIDLASLSDEQVEGMIKLLEKSSGKKNKAGIFLSENEEKYRNIFENIQSVYFETNLDSTIIDISLSVEFFTKYKRNELIGTKAVDLYVNKKDREKLFRLNLENNKLRDQYFEIKDKDGSKLLCSLNAQLIKNKKGIPVKLVGSFIDLTKLHKTINALTASEEKYRNIFENIQAVYYEAAIDGTILEISPSVEYYTKYKREELIGRDVFESYFRREDRENLIRQISINGILRDYNIKLKDKDDSKLHCSINAKLIRNKLGVPEKIVGAIIDITQLHKTLNDLKASENRFKDIYENTNDIIYTMDFNGNFTSVNPMAEKMLGYKFEEITKLNMSSYISPETAKVAFDNINKKLRGETTNTLYEVDFVNKDGSYTSLEINSMINYRDGKPFEIFGIARNITERKKAEEELNKTREKYKELAETTNDLVYTVSLDQKFSSMHTKCERIIGYKAQELIGRKVNDFLTSESRKASNESLRKKLKGETTNTIYEVDFINKDGSITSLEVNSMFRYKDGNPYEILGVARNISNRKRISEALKKSEEKYKTIFENAPIGIMTTDTKGNIIEINSTYMKLIGSKSLEETKNINVFQLQHLIDTGMVDAFKQCINTGNPIVKEASYTSVWGKLVNAKFYLKSLKDTNKKVTGLQVIIEDITDEKMAEQELKTTLSEKEALLRELHHRVKNNMQIIISLINMQMRESNDEVMKGKLRDIQQRVWTMSIIHENLYVSENLSQINFGNYLQMLASNVAYLYRGNNNIDVKVNVSPVFLDIDNAIPCGIIVNEILSNSFKHAFPEKWKGKNNEVYIGLETKGNKYLLIIGDNGIGMKEQNKNTEINTMGLELIEILVKQLKASLKLHTKKGTRYEIELNNK